MTTLKQISLNATNINDSFWSKYLELIRTKVLPYQWDILNDRVSGAKPSHCIENFRVASGKVKGEFKGMVFQDSDVYKWLEAVAYSLMWHKDENLEKLADSAIADICAAQMPDGYLNTYYIINGIEKRFTNLQDHHELYCLGHLIEAAIAYYQATNKRKLLDATIRYVDLVDEIFGEEQGKLHGYPGHEIIEMALAKLYQVTNEKRHLNLAKYFIEERGKQPLYFESECRNNNNDFYWKDSYFRYQYYQAGKPVREQDKAEGHAVRAVYLYSGIADLARETDDPDLLKVCEKLWSNITQRQMYITGGIGATQYGESFTYDYDLPNDTIYAETCASIGLVFFAKRMFEITKESKYIDVMERAFYNGVISGMSLDGNKFFYVNPLEVVPEASEKDHLRKHVKVERQKWFECACCPPNLSRIILSLGNYVYSTSDDTLFINLFVGGNVTAKLKNSEIKFRVHTNYPWDGKVELEYISDSSKDFKLALRIPCWSNTTKTILNNEEVEVDVQKGYAYINRSWQQGDKVELQFDMNVQITRANPRVREDIGKVAVTRGPIVYCLEEIDNGKSLQSIYLEDHTEFNIQYREDLLNGVVTLESDCKMVSDEQWEEDELYSTSKRFKLIDRKVTWIPYYSWANRKPGEMTVWVKNLII